MQLRSRQISLIYRRLLYKNRLCPINIKFTKTNTFYDNALSNLPNEFINILPYDNNDSLIDTHVLFINDPIEFLQKQSEFKSIISPKVMFFHDNKISFMKKEDRFLFIKQIDSFEKYSFDKSVCETIPGTTLIKYGVEANNPEPQKTKSIIFIGNQQNIDHVIFSNIKNLYKDAEFISSDKLTELGSNTISSYKICICMNSLYNNLLASANGCCVISSLPNPGISNYYEISNVEGILTSIDMILKNYDNIKLPTAISTIQNEYDYSTFKETITNITNSSINRQVIL